MDKICSTCGVEKSTKEYYKDIRTKDGFRNTCKDCGVQNKSYKEHLDSIQEKTCNHCKVVKPLDQFVRDERTTLGFSRQCLQCAQIKLCRGCQTKKHISEFSTGTRSKDGLRYTCKECDNAKARERYKGKAGDVIRTRNARYQYKKGTQEGNRERLLAKYGLTFESYEALLEEQGRRCKICGALEGERGRPMLAVDHDHETGLVRGLLCDPCNRALGMFKDDPEILASAIQYLHAHFG